MIMLYSRILKISLEETNHIIQEIFPENIPSIIENGKVYLSDGEIFSSSAEKEKEGLILFNAEYNGKLNDFEKNLNHFLSKLNETKAIYDIEWEVEIKGKYESKFIRHPLFATSISALTGV